jgi:arylsulfatase A-like enzyme
MSREAAEFIAANKDRPFYLNYWAFSVHSPWQGKQALVEKYRAKADPSSQQRNPVYGAMVQSFDEGVGRLIDALDQNGVAGNTLIILFSDNGGVHWSPNAEPAMMHPEFKGLEITSNAPLRGGKATLYEGGTREPCVIVWPGQVQAGSKSDAIISSIDFNPTILEATGAKPDPGQKPDGISIIPALKGRRLNREAVFCHFPHYTPRTGNVPGTWVRKGDWKLIRLYCDNDDQTDRFELYNLKGDLSETNNLAATMPAKVTELNALIDGFLRDTEALIPKPNPAYRKGT